LLQYMTIRVVVSATRHESYRLSGRAGRHSAFRVPQIASWHTKACGDFICCPRYHLSAPLSGQRGFEASHNCALGPTGSQDVAWCLHLSLLVTHRDCILISHQGIITLGIPSADHALRPSAAT
jgi:hypothetical protein